MVPLRSVHVSAYRGLRDVRLDALGAFNVLVGPNNGGKTSMLEAIGLVLRPMIPGQWLQTALTRDPTVSVVDGVWGMFPGSHVLSGEQEETTSNKLELRAELRGEDVERIVSATAEAFAEPYTASNDPSSDEWESVVRVAVGVEPFGNRYEMELSPKPRRLDYGPRILTLRCFTITPFGHTTKQLVDHFSEAIDAGAKGLALEVVHLFDEGVTDIGVTRSMGRAGLRVTHKTRGVVDVMTFGDGLRHALALALGLVRARQNVLLIDEIESGLHVRAFGKLMAWFLAAARALDVQVFATTHSLEALDAMLDAPASDSLVVHYMDRRNEVTRVRRFAGPRLHDLRGEGLDLR